MRAPRVVVGSAILAAMTFSARPSAADPDPGVGMVAGAAVLLLGFTVGGAVIATAEGADGPTNTGWTLIESGFVLAPLTAHAVVGQWARGLAFAAPPAAFEGGNIGLMAGTPGVILHGTLAQQRIFWGLFGLGFASSVVGVIDVTFAAPRLGPVAIAPALGPGAVGIQVGGNL